MYYWVYLFGEIMKLIITSGATFAPWDNVRGIANKSQGTTGAKLAEEALIRGHKVKYISDTTTKKPFEMKINPLNIDECKKLEIAKSVYANYEFMKATTFDQYMEQSLIAPLKEEKAVFISTAAVSDYAPVVVKGKVRSIEEQMRLEIKKLPKVINEVKKKFPLMPIVGFKLLSEEDNSISELIDIAYKSLLSSKMALVVANLVDKDFKPTTTVIITPEKNIIPVVNRNDLSKTLMDVIESRICCDFYQTKVIGDLPDELPLKEFSSLIEDCSTYSLFASYGDGRKGAEFGSVGMRTNFGILATGRGTTKKETNSSNVAIIKEIKENRVSILSNKAKATLNASTLWHIFQERSEVKFVVHAHVYLPNGVDVMDDAAPSTFEDYKIIESAVKDRSVKVINQIGHGCFILLNKKEDLLDVLMENGIYNSKYSNLYDIAYHRFKKGSLETTVESLNIKKSANVLDLACGTGKSSHSLCEMGFVNVHIADASKDMLKVAEKRLGIKGTVATFEDMSNIKKTYDLITIRQAFSYLKPNNVSLFIDNIKEKLNHNGVLVFNGFHLLTPSVNSRYDEFEIEKGYIKTLETNIITKDEIFHSQRSEYLDLEKGIYMPLYDINKFYQHDIKKVMSLFESKGFKVQLNVSGKSFSIQARKV